MALPSLPSQGQDPWYETRTTWDNAVKAELEGRLSEDQLSTARDIAIAANWAGTYLGDVHLDTVTTPGRYRQGTTSLITAGNGYPLSGAYGRGTLEVLQWGGSNAVTQRYTTIGTGTAHSGRLQFIRRLEGSTWSPWVAIPSQRVDETAGRAIYTWDDVNNREQLIYGDTGWRDVRSLLANGWTVDSASAGILLRRYGNKVTLKIHRLDGSEATRDDFLLTSDIGSGFHRAVGGTYVPIVTSLTTVGALSLQSNIQLARSTPMFVSGFMEASWETSQPWPTSLPGNGVGSIPTS